MTTQQIRFFLEAANCLNFSKAARNLFVSQPTLSKQIALLEEELGVKLFSRSNRAVTLTAAGAMLRGEMSKVENTIFSAMERARFMEQGIDGRLSVAILELADPASSVTPLLMKLREKYPRLDLNISFLGFSAIREGLEDGSIDVAFSKDYDARVMAGLCGIDIQKNTPSVIMARSHPLAASPSLTVRELKEENFVVLSAAESRASAQTLIDLCGKNGFFPKIVKYAESHADRLYYVQLGYGISVVDKDVPLPRWADLVTVPLLSDDSDAFTGINLRMMWLDSCANSSLPLLIETAREMFSGPAR